MFGSRRVKVPSNQMRWSASEAQGRQPRGGVSGKRGAELRADEKESSLRLSVSDRRATSFWAQQSSQLLVALPV